MRKCHELDYVNLIARCLYSINKYAKNYRDGVFVEGKLSPWERKKREKSLYALKENVLCFFRPSGIHVLKNRKMARERIYENDPRFQNSRGKVHVLHAKNDLYPFKFGKNMRKKEFFLYYELGGFKFHIPIKDYEVWEYKNLSHKKLPKDFCPQGEDPNLLIEEDVAVQILNDFLSIQGGKEKCKSTTKLLPQS